MLRQCIDKIVINVIQLVYQKKGTKDSMENLFEKAAKNITQKIDDKLYEFLEDNGYHIERNNAEQVIELKDKLAKEDKQIRWEAAIVGINLTKQCEYILHSLIFFDSISNPLSEEKVRELIINDYYKK